MRAGVSSRGQVCGAAVAMALAFLIVYWVSVRTVAGREFGDAALRGALLTQDAFSRTVDRVLDVVSVATLAGALALVATIALVRLARVPGLAALGLMVAANGSAWLLKHHLLSRPDLGLDEYTPATLNSLPSGHTTAVFSAVAAVLVVLPTRWRSPAAIAGGALALVTALATMSAGWHRAADSLAAFLLVGFWTCVAVAVVMTLTGSGHPGVREPETPRTGVTRWLVPVTAGSLLLGLALAVLLDALSGLRDTSVGQAVALLASAALVAGMDAGVLRVMLLALDVGSRARPATDGVGGGPR